MENNKSWSLGYEFLDIEVINHSKTNGEPEKWNCDQCSLYFLTEEKLNGHKSRQHISSTENIKCIYCQKILTALEVSKECFANQKCETCEYRCSKCPQRFLRRSSLLNHENNHFVPRKRKVSLAKKSQINDKKKIESPKIPKKRKSEAVATDSSSNNNNSTSLPKKSVKKLSVTPKKKIKLSLDNADANVGCNREEETLPHSNKSPKISKISKQVTAKSPTSFKKKPVLSAIKQLSAQSAATSSSVNAVNYKPFSCHVCNDNFASDNALLEHLKTHGAAAEVFKCKFCGDKFEDIYKMQYHLAICPFAEDEMDATIISNASPNLKIKATTITPDEIPKQRKRGRPKKYGQDSSDEGAKDIAVNELPLPKIRKSLKKVGVMHDAEPTNTTSQVTSPLMKSECNLRTSEPLLMGEPESSCNETINYADGVGDESGGDVDKSGPDEAQESGRRKLHACPFPRCNIKFTREKALLCHMRNHSDDFDDSLKCHKCDLPFDDIKSLRLHINECRGVKEEEEEDDEDFQGRYRVKAVNSSSKNFQKSRGSFQCNICNRTYASEEKLQRHEALHRSSKFHCRICKDVFQNQSLLDQHFLDYHPTKSSYHCEICDEDFISELFLQIHMADYHRKAAGSESTCVAKDCPKEKDDESNNVPIVYPKVTRLVDELATTGSVTKLTNLGTQMFWCPVCYQGFDQRKYLRSHLKSIHTSKSPSINVCEICDIEKPTAELLCWHLEMHSSNIYSVNRFSKLRTLVKSEERKSSTILAKKILQNEKVKEVNKEQVKLASDSALEHSEQIVLALGGIKNVKETDCSYVKITRSISEETVLSLEGTHELQNVEKSDCSSSAKQIRSSLEETILTLERTHEVQNVEETGSSSIKQTRGNSKETVLSLEGTHELQNVEKTNCSSVKQISSSEETILTLEGTHVVQNVEETDCSSSNEQIRSSSEETIFTPEGTHEVPNENVSQKVVKQAEETKSNAVEQTNQIVKQNVLQKAAKSPLKVVKIVQKKNDISNQLPITLETSVHQDDTKDLQLEEPISANKVVEIIPNINLSSYQTKDNILVKEQKRKIVKKRKFRKRKDVFQSWKNKKRKRKLNDKNAKKNQNAVGHAQNNMAINNKNKAVSGPIKESEMDDLETALAEMHGDTDTSSQKTVSGDSQASVIGGVNAPEEGMKEPSQSNLTLKETILDLDNAKANLTKDLSDFRNDEEDNCSSDTIKEESSSKIELDDNICQQSDDESSLESSSENEISTSDKLKVSNKITSSGNKRRVKRRPHDENIAGFKCSMCSLMFHNQDELVDHVGFHL